VNRNQRVSASRRKPVLGVLTFVGAVLAYTVVFGRHGLIQYFALRADLGHRSAQAYERLDRNREITQRLRGLQTDSRMLEEAARSTLGVVHEDEIVVVFRNARGSRRR
jgi:cell division protein FtsB